MKSVLITNEGNVFKRSDYPNKFGEPITGLPKGWQWMLVKENEMPKIDEAFEKLTIDEEITPVKDREYPHLGIFQITYGKARKSDQEIETFFEEKEKNTIADTIDRRMIPEIMLKGFSVLIKLSRSESISDDEDRFLSGIIDMSNAMEVAKHANKVKFEKAKSAKVKK